MNIIPSTVGHRSRELPGGVCRYCVEAGASRIACVIRTPLPGPSPCRSRLGSAAEPVAAQFVDSVQNALSAVDDDGVGHALSVVRHERACCVAAVVVRGVVSKRCCLPSCAVNGDPRGLPLWVHESSSPYADCMRAQVVCERVSGRRTDTFIYSCLLFIIIIYTHSPIS